MSASAGSTPPSRCLRLRPRYKAFAVEGEAVFLVGERDREILEGQIFVDLLPFLNDGIDEALVADALESTYPRSHIHYAFEVLIERGLVTEGPRCATTGEEAFWDELGLDCKTVTARLAATHVGVTAIGAIDPRPLVEALDALGMAAGIVATPADESLHIVMTDDYLDPALEQLAAINRRDDRPWMLARGAGSEIWIGPLFRNGHGCLECLCSRLRTGAAFEAYVGRRLGDGNGITRAIAQNRPLGAVAGNLVALEAAKWAAGFPEPTPRVRTIDLRTLQSAEHVLQQRPQCRVCGNPDLQTEILTRPVRIAEDEQPMRATLDHLAPFVSNVTGIVTGLVRVETGIESLHTYTGFFGFGRDAVDLQAVKNSMLSQAAGVGATAEEAKIGAICEALERYCGMCHGDEPSAEFAYAELDPATAVHPGACMLYSSRQYAARETINAQGDAFDMVPRPFDESTPLHWTGVWSLSAKRFKLLPSTYLFYNFPQPPGGPFCWADSNGCAAGASLADAIRRGLYELVERDSVAIWWYNRLRRPAVDLASFRSDYFDSFVESYSKLRREVWVLDLTSDLAIPSFVAISRSIRGGPEDILLAFGAHLDARAAIEHALFELNHILPAVLPENRNRAGDYLYPDPAQKRWWRHATIESEPYLVPDPNLQELRAEHYGPVVSRSEAQQAKAVCARLEQHGLEVMVLNQTRPDVGIPVAKVMVPGMRHFWSRLGPGRLYDVPVKMGWLDRPRPEEDMNPIAMFL
jgi:oxazoline/thiazoline synthase